MSTNCSEMRLRAFIMSGLFHILGITILPFCLGGEFLTTGLVIKYFGRGERPKGLAGASVLRVAVRPFGVISEETPDDRHLHLHNHSGCSR
jgi:hypothetical protein